MCLCFLTLFCNTTYKKALLFRWNVSLCLSNALIKILGLINNSLYFISSYHHITMFLDTASFRDTKNCINEIFLFKYLNTTLWESKWSQSTCVHIFVENININWLYEPSRETYCGIGMTVTTKIFRFPNWIFLLFPDNCRI